MSVKPKSYFDKLRLMYEMIRAINIYDNLSFIMQNDYEQGQGNDSAVIAMVTIIAQFKHTERGHCKGIRVVVWFIH